jgi:non-specific serine/threonine protein kinase
MPQSIPLMSEAAVGEIDPAQRELRIRGEVVTIGSRAFEIVEMLVKSAGQLVTKAELMRQIWPGAIVEDNTIQVHISAIRKALGPDRGVLKTLSGRGYRLLGHWSIREGSAPQPPEASMHVMGHTGSFFSNIPVAASSLIGRAAILRDLDDLLSAYRIVTLTGPGGIGKTVLAVEIARRQFPTLKGDVWFVELASLSDPELLASTVGSTLGLKLGAAEIKPSFIAEAIGCRRVLLVLDNCEHVVDAAAVFVEILTRNCPRCTVLVTSREVLRVDGECVCRVPPLEVPGADDEAPDSILTRSAVELFVARAKARDSDFLPHPGNLAATAAICRHLDGIPLAIEFAAARAAALGVKQVAAGLYDCLAMLTNGRRTALPRHHTLRAVLNWSYELLPEHERRLLRYLSLFPAGFTLDAAAAVMMGARFSVLTVSEAIENLVLKSLIVRSKTELVTRWYLLETTRAFARERLEESGETGQAALLHAQFYLALYTPFSTEGRLQFALDNLATYRLELDNFRAALDWAFSPGGDSAIGVALAVVGADFWAAISLFAEGCEWAKTALSRIGDAAGTRSEMVLLCNLGMTLIYTKGMVSTARESLTRGLALAQRYADSDYQQRAMSGLWLFSARSSALDEALAIARAYESVVPPGDRQSRAMADWLIGVPLIYRAEHIEASTRLLRAVDQYPIERRSQDTVRLGSDLLASALGHVSVSLLSRGLIDTATQAATRAVEYARDSNQPTALCIALAWAAGFIFLSLGELDKAERYGEELIIHAQKHRLRPFHAAGLCVRGSLAARRGAPDIGIDLIRRGLADMRVAAYLLFYPIFLIELAAALGASHRIDDGLSEIDEALRFAMETGHRWAVPETLRVKAELLVRRGSDDPSAIMDLLRESMSQAHKQHALYWELSAAISLAELMQSQHMDAEANAVLVPVCNRLIEGSTAPRVKQAKAMLR